VTVARDVTPREPSTGGADGARAAVRHIFASWCGRRHGAGRGSEVLARLSELLAPMRGEDAFGREVEQRGLMNAQISVDSRHPGQLRLTLDPFAGESFWEVRRERLLDVLGTVTCPPLLERALRLHRLGYALPQSFWLGVAPAADHCVVKAYVASPDPAIRGWLPALTRDAGWLPPTVGSAFVAFHDRLVPSLAAVEGIGISFDGETWLGTTFYLRSMVPWGACASTAMAELLGITPAESLERLSEIFRTTPTTFGWSVECAADGALVDSKLEVAIGGPYSPAAVAGYARRFGIESRPVEALAAAIGEAGLADGGDAAPVVMSLRLVDGSPRSLVAYFPLIGRS
jgi:hypothetical protein